MDFVSFGIILDDIVFPDGKTCMAVLGGGGPQTAFGMRLWAKNVGVVSGVGLDFPNIPEEISQSSIDSRGIRFTDAPTLRAWQILEADGRRVQLWRTPPKYIQTQLSRSFDLLPPDYQCAKGFHFGIHAENYSPEFSRSLTATGGLVSVELFRKAERPMPLADLRTILESIDLFSFNLEEGQSLVNVDEPDMVIRKLFDAGAKTVTIRMGSRGSIIADSYNNLAFHIPAFPLAIKNTVGAGNAYCGGFLTGLQQSGNLETAGLYGAVAASFLLEQVGTPIINKLLLTEAQKRVKKLRPDVQNLKI